MTAAFSGRDIVFGDFAVVVDFDGGELARHELRGDAPDRLGDSHVWADHLQRLRCEHRGVDGVAGWLARENIDDLLGHVDGDALLGFGRGGAEVGREDDARVAEQRIVGRMGSVVKTSIAAPATLPDCTASASACLIDDAAAGDVDEAHAVLHLRDLVAADHAVRAGRERRVHGDEVCVANHVIELDRFHAERSGAFRRHERVDREHAHVHGDGMPGDFGTDLAEAHDAERLAANFGADERLAVPVAGVHRGIGLGDVPGERDQQRERVLGGGDRVPLRRVDDDDAALRGCFEVDVVDAHARPADGDEAVWRLR